jgi:tetratricopeptide (TPR) repeat protein
MSMVDPDAADPTRSLPDEDRSGAALDAARAAYLEALSGAPDNLVVSMRLAALDERLGRYLDAVGRYDHLERTWPDIFEPRYRMAATLGMAEAWAPKGPSGPATAGDFEGMSAALVDRGGRRRPSRGGTGSPDPFDALRGALVKPTMAVVEECLKVASARWISADAHLRFLPSLGRALHPRRRRDGDRRHHVRLLFAFEERARNRQSVRLAHECTRAQLIAPAPQRILPVPGMLRPGPDEPEDGVEEGRKAVARVRAAVEALARDDHLLDWTGHYNAACAYARLYQVGGEAGDLDAAFAELQRAQDVTSDDVFSLAEGDPDLVAIVSLGPVLDWCVRPVAEEVWPCVHRWAARSARDLAAWWRHWAVVLQNDAGLQEAADSADDRMWVALIDAFTVASPGPHLQRFVDEARSIHVRFCQPPLPTTMADPDVLGGVEGLRATYREAPPGSVESRASRWTDLVDAIESPRTSAARGGQP